MDPALAQQIRSTHEPGARYFRSTSTTTEVPAYRPDGPSDPSSQYVSTAGRLDLVDVTSGRTLRTIARLQKGQSVAGTWDGARAVYHSSAPPKTGADGVFVWAVGDSAPRRLSVPGRYVWSAPVVVGGWALWEERADYGKASYVVAADLRTGRRQTVASGQSLVGVLGDAVILFTSRESSGPKDTFTMSARTVGTWAVRPLPKALPMHAPFPARQSDLSVDAQGHVAYVRPHAGSGDELWVADSPTSLPRRLPTKVPSAEYGVVRVGDLLMVSGTEGDFVPTSYIGVQHGAFVTTAVRYDARPEPPGGPVGDRVAVTVDADRGSAWVDAARLASALHC